jgi:hypothetical protein
MVAALCAALVAGCGGPPGPTDLERRPEIVGLITGWDYADGGMERYTLDSGHVVDLNVDDNKDLPATPRIGGRNFELGFRPGPVTGRGVFLLVGHDPDGAVWYAAAHETYVDRCPFVLEGAAVYDEGSVVHFSTGLVLPKSPDFDAPDDVYPRAGVFRLRESDRLCIDRTGTAVRVELSAWGSGELTGLNFVLPFIFGGLLLVVVMIAVVVALVVRRVAKRDEREPR